MQIKKSNEHFDKNGNMWGIICLLGALNLRCRNEDTMLHIYYGKDGKLTAYRLFLLIKRRVVCVEIFAICMILRNTEGIAESLEMCDLSLTEEFDGIADIGIVYETEDVIIGYTSLLFGCEVFVQIGKYITLDSDIGRGKGCSCGRLRINACGMIDKIGVKARFFDFLGGQVSGELIKDRRNHFHVGKFFCTERSNEKITFQNRMKNFEIDI